MDAVLERGVGATILEKVTDQDKCNGEEPTHGIRALPSKGALVKKKRPGAFLKRKARIVACGNYQEYEEHVMTYASGVDATSVRLAMRIAVLSGWQLRAKDVSTAFLNTPYTSKGALILKTPRVVVEAGLMKHDEAWLVGVAKYGLEESQKLWSIERDSKIES